MTSKQTEGNYTGDMLERNEVTLKKKKENWKPASKYAFLWNSDILKIASENKKDWLSVVWSHADEQGSKW